MPKDLEDLIGKMPPVRVDTLATALQRLSVVSPHLLTDLNLELFPPEGIFLYHRG